MTAPAQGSATLVTLLTSDLLASTSLLERLGDERAADLFARHDRMARDLQAAHGAREIDKTDGFLLIFDRATTAVLFALAYHEGLATLGTELGVTLEARVGIHVGEVILRENSPADVARGAKPVEVEGLAKPVAARLMGLASGRQTLMTRGAFDLARRGTVKTGAEITWLAHGAYHVKGIDEALDVYEVGRHGVAPLTAPADTEKAQRVVDPDTIVGWRPAPGVEVPGRPNWVLEEKIGVGGFGDVWRAEHKKTHEQRVYKFCYDARRLNGLKREVTLVRLLKFELGDRRDIARVLDWNFDDVPYFLESEWTRGGSLEQWLAGEGGAAAVPIAARIEIVAQVADALAAAHSVGVLHKDVKPANILITRDADGTPRACLTDFGIGLVTDHDKLAHAGITALGFTEVRDPGTADSSLTGTRLYMAPELTEGKPATVHADVYALGVMLYQMVIGDLTRAFGSGWESDVADGLLLEDIASAVVRIPEQRIDVRRLAQRLRQLDERRRERAAEASARASAERARKRRTLVGLVAAGMVLVAAATGVQLRRVATEAQRANREAETSRRVSEFMIELFRLADPGEARGNSVTAREILDEGARRIESALVDQPAIRAVLMVTMGKAYLGLGLHAAARPVAAQALAIRTREFGARSAEAAEALVLLGDVDKYAGDFDTAEKRYREAAEIRIARFGTPHVLVAEAMAEMGESQWLKGDYPRADSNARAAVVMYRRLGSPPAPLAAALGNLGVVVAMTGRNAEAEPLFREALALTRAEHRPDDKRVAQMLSNLGATLTQLGRLDEARDVSLEALALYRKLLGPKHPTTAMSELDFAVLLQQQKQYGEAEALVREAVASFEVADGPHHPFTAQARANLAAILADEGQCGEAETMSRDAGAVLARVLPAGHWSIAHAESVLGQCLAARGRDSEAEALLTRSYSVLQGTQRGSIWERAALQRVIAFYERTGNTAKAAEYRALRTSAR